MKEEMLSERDILELKRYGLLREGETAVKFSDMILAVNLTTQDRRVIDTKNIILESTRRVLRG